ncbi:MAG: hypothetical protein V4725_18045 [Bacteroidota bacterium]
MKLKLDLMEEFCMKGRVKWAIKLYDGKPPVTAEVNHLPKWLC